MATYRLFPDQGLWPIALLITGSEWVLAVWLLSGWNLESDALVAHFPDGLYGLYGAGLGITLLRGIDLPDCGCYGVFSPQPLRWYSPLEEMVLVGMRYALWRSENRPRSC